MSRTKLVPLVGPAGMAVLLLAGCDGGGLSGAASQGPASAFLERPAASDLAGKDIEAPEIFQKTESGLWDGRPSLGGVWVAHPDVTDPERVVIRNEANGQTVIGALFRRERENPGPRIQVSSDAAAALGLLAGAPTKLSVTALRRETPEPDPAAAAPETAETAQTDAASDPAPTDAAADAASDTAVAPQTAQAEAPAEAEAPQKRRWNPFRRKAAEAEASAAPILAEPDAVETATLAPADAAAPLGAASVAALAETAQDTALNTAQGTAEIAAEPAASLPLGTAESEAPKARWNPFRRAAPEPASALRPGALEDIAASAEDISAPAQSLTDSAAAPEALVSEPVATKPRWSLFRRAEPAPASALREGALTGEAADGLPAATLTPVSSSRSAAAPSQGTYVQIGSFASKDNAEKAAATMRRNGIVPNVIADGHGTATLWRVTVGPAFDTAERSTLLAKVRDLGFADSYSVSR